MANRMRFGWASASMDVARKWLRQARSVAHEKLLELMRVVVLLLGTAANAQNAQGEMRCAALDGDEYIYPEAASTLLFYHFGMFRAGLMQSPTQQDRPDGQYDYGYIVIEGER